MFTRNETKKKNRFAQFIETTEKLDWSTDPAVALHALFDSIIELILWEIQYYARQCRWRKFWSLILRFLALLFGAFGILIPLLDATEHPWWQGWNPWGYVFLAISAAFFGANSLFAATTGHIQSVTTQITLEKLLVGARVRWLAMHAGGEKVRTPEQLHDSFRFLDALVDELYQVVIAETSEWATLLRDNLERVEKQYSSQQKTGS